MPTGDPIPPSEPLLHPDQAVEELVRTFIVEGQRQELWLRTEPDGDVWHNAAVFRRSRCSSARQTSSNRWCRALAMGLMTLNSGKRGAAAGRRGAGAAGGQG